MNNYRKNDHNENEYSFYLSTKKKVQCSNNHASLCKRSVAWCIDKLVALLVLLVVSISILFLLLIIMPKEFPDDAGNPNEYRRSGYNMSDPQQAEEFWDLPDNHLDGMGYMIVWGFLFLAVLLISAIVSGGVQLYYLFRHNQTVGMRFMNIMVISTKEDLLLPQQIIIRTCLAELPGYIPKVGWIIYLANYCAIFRETRQCLHDQFAQTVVIDLFHC